MNSIWHLARKEFEDSLRNRWLLAITLVFILLALGIAWFGAAASGRVGLSSVSSTVASLASLATFLIPLIALLVAYDAIVGEDEGGTLLLLLTYPLGRGQLLLGKFLGHGMILAIASVIGFGSAALLMGTLAEEIGIAELLWAFGRFIGSSILLGWVFLALAYVISALAVEKSKAAGLALGVWFGFVLVFDLALLGGVVAGEGAVDPKLLSWLLLLNPTDIYRLINLGGLEGYGNLAGMLALGKGLTAGVALWWVLLLWIGLPLMLAHRFFKRRKV